MANTADRPVLMLTIIAGAMDVMTVERAFSKVEIKKTIREVSNMAKRAAYTWPGMNKKRLKTVKKNFELFAECVNPPERSEEYKPVEVTYIAHRIACDMADLYRTGNKRRLISPLLPGIEKLISHMDPEGINYQAMDAANTNMDKLYAIMGLRDDDFKKTYRKVA